MEIKVMAELTEKEQVELDKYLEELIGKYIENKSKENEFKSAGKEIANEVDEILHHIKKNSVKVYISAVNAEYEAKYIDRKGKKVDYVRLAEVLSDEMYNDVITETESTYLQIRKAAAKKSSKRKKPVSDVESNLPIPKGVIWK
jgi:hypothetical protein